MDLPPKVPLDLAKRMGAIRNLKESIILLVGLKKEVFFSFQSDLKKSDLIDRI